MLVGEERGLVEWGVYVWRNDWTCDGRADSKGCDGGDDDFELHLGCCEVFGKV